MNPYYQLHDYKALLDLSVSELLLPNLRSLTFYYGRAPLSLMLLFISPSLVKYSMVYINLAPPPLIGVARSTAILSALHRRCPALHTLELYAYNADSRTDQDEQYLIPTQVTRLTDFNTSILRNLSTSLFILGQIDDLRPLSRLDRLGILYDEKNRIPTTLPKFKDVEWPNLRYLSIYLLPNLECLTRLWDAITLIANLTSLVVELDNVFMHDRRRANLVGTLTTFLAEHSPNLTDLSLYQRDAPLEPHCITALPMSLVTNLKLHKLVMNNGVSVPGAPTDLSQHLRGRTFGWIKNLDWQPYCVDLEALELFAQSMPNLESLDIGLDIPSSGVKEVVSDRSHQRKFSLHVSHALFDGSKEKRSVDWVGPSRYILSLWPNVDMWVGYYANSRFPGWREGFKQLQAQKTE
ncbi:hypothetical protein FRC10_010260 [Ceratobasidium sp. 414]|nr:hypothetical protein FRC10_010260 [Ceratobasidium sp. 414]